MWGRVFLSVVLSSTVACGDDATPAASAAGAGGGSTTGSGGEGAGTCEPGALGAGTHTLMLSHGGLERSYIVHLPDAAGTTPLPLVLNFHGYTSNAEQQALFSDMNATADAHGFAVAYPEGFMSSWNGGALCCGEASAQDLDDVGFARALVADLAAQACIDEKRVYSTGMSNGGFMSHRLGCEGADFITAIGPVAGLLGIPAESCQPSRPVPVIHFYGTEDTLVPYDFADDVDLLWAERNGCGDDPQVTFDQGNVTCTTRSACDEGVEVTLCAVEGGGHCWPGTAFCPFGTSTTDISANEAMWALFERFALP